MHVLCVGMFRACSTWQYQVASELVERHYGGRRLGYLTGDEYAAALRSGAIGTGEWVVLKSHDRNRPLAQALASGRALGLYAHRDPRDAIVSLSGKLDTPAFILIHTGMAHRLLVNDRFWRTRPHVLTQRYESIVADPVQAVLQIGKHLELGLSPAEAREVACLYSLEANRRRAEALRRSMEAQGISPGDATSLLYCDAQTLLHWNHIQGGSVGKWRDALAGCELRLLARICGRWLIANGYETGYAWVPPPPEAGCLQRIVLSAVLWRESTRAGLACWLYYASLRAPRAVGLLRRVLRRVRSCPAEPAAWPRETAEAPHHLRAKARS